MPLDLQRITTKSAPLTVTFLGQSTPVTYDPSVLTAEFINASAQSDTAFFENFCLLVKSWDVRRGNTKVPLTEKALRTVPLPFLRAVYQAVMRDAGEGEPESNSSDG